MAEPRYLNARDTAHYLSIGVSTLHQLVNAGRLPKPIVLTPRVKRWDKVAIDQAIAAGRVPDPHEDMDRITERAVAVILNGDGRRAKSRGRRAAKKG